MTITQLEYIVAVDDFRHFGKAAKHCKVTQPTLSMQINKLEEAWNVRLFDRAHKPILPTKTGEWVVAQARIVLREVKKMDDFIESTKGVFQGVFKIGVIPTISPYLLHRIIKPFQALYPDVKCLFEEATTDTLLRKLREEQIDVAILATPLGELGLDEEPLYYEPFIAFVHPSHRLSKDAFILNSELNPKDLLLLSEGHCFRNSVLNMCQYEEDVIHNNLSLESGSFETLIRLVKQGFGMTLLPYLAVMELHESDKKWTKPLAEPRPVREIGMVFKHGHLKTNLINALKRVVQNNVPEKLLKNEGVVLSPKRKE
ncbi:MAG: hydrogen peroxide-inducible genes activator [Cryomorphaceae bacterium]|nr:hydrogen peroxide-inducible genes activator [Cryomorphaceae bacterium]